jgi:putative transposase
MIDKDDANVSVRSQCELLSVARSTLYYERKKENPGRDCYLKEDIQDAYMKYPFYGIRRLLPALRSEYGWKTLGRSRLKRLRDELGLVTVYPKKKFRTSIPNTKHKKYPYLLDEVLVSYSNQVWVSDITYLNTKFGRAYVMAIQDLYSRKVVAWRVSNTMDVSFCLEALEEAIRRHGAPEIFNSDQGSQFTSDAFTEELKSNGVKISMTGKGRVYDNIFAERLWRSIKTELIELYSCESLREIRKAVNRYLLFYNQSRYHQALGYEVPNKFYAQGLFNKTG